MGIPVVSVASADAAQTRKNWPVAQFNFTAAVLRLQVQVLTGHIVCEKIRGITNEKAEQLVRLGEQLKSFGRRFFEIDSRVTLERRKRMNELAEKLVSFAAILQEKVIKMISSGRMKHWARLEELLHLTVYTVMSMSRFMHHIFPPQDTSTTEEIFILSRPIIEEMYYLAGTAIRARNLMLEKIIEKKKKASLIPMLKAISGRQKFMKSLLLDKNWKRYELEEFRLLAKKFRFGKNIKYPGKNYDAEIHLASLGETEFLLEKLQKSPEGQHV